MSGDRVVVGPSRLAQELPALDELAAPSVPAAHADEACVRLEPLAASPLRRVLVRLPWARAIDPRAQVLFESLGARVRALHAQTPRTAAAPGSIDAALSSSTRAVLAMVAALRELDSMASEADRARRRGPMRA